MFPNSNTLFKLHSFTQKLLSKDDICCTTNYEIEDNVLIQEQQTKV